MKFFKNKKLMIILSCALLLCIIALGILYFSHTNTNEEKTLPKTDSQSEVTDTQTNKNETKDNATDKNDAPNINEGNGPVNTHSGNDIVGKIDKFNSLNDGDPEKEKIRKELEDLFASAEGTTIN